MNFLAAVCSSMPADCSRNTKGPALPSMIGTSGGGEIDVHVVDAKARERRHQMLDRRHAHAVLLQARRQPRVADGIRIGLDLDRLGRSMRRNTMPVSGAAGRNVR